MVLPHVASALMASVVYASAVMAQAATELDECGKVVDALQKQAALSQNPSIPFDLVKACYSVFPADIEFKAQHVKEYKPYIEAYPFADLYLSPPGPPRTFGAAGIDILKELDRLVADASINTQYDFFDKISDLASSLEDGHFGHFPECMTTFTSSQPFRLGANYNAEGSPVIKILDTSPTSPVWDEALATSDLSTFLNYTVKSIDGLNAADAIQVFADKETLYARSADSRFNTALAIKIYIDGEFSIVQGAFSDRFFLPPDTKPITYVLTPPTLADGTQPADITVTVPWASFPRTISTDIPAITNAEYYETFCVVAPSERRTLARRELAQTTSVIGGVGPRQLIPRTTTPASALDAAHAVPKISDAVLANALSRHHAHQLQRRQAAGGEPVPIAGDADTAFYVLEDGITGVWVFATTRPGGSYEEWFGTITGGLRAFEQIGVKRLIIDVTANGGGDFCASTAFAEYVLQNTTMIEDQLRLTPAVKALFKADFYDFKAVIPASGPGGDVITEAYLQDRGNGPQLLSGRFKFCQNTAETPAGYIRAFNLPELERGWAPEDVAAVSEGGCGSACACMIRSMRDAHPGFKTYTYAGRSGKPYTPTSFEGGIVARYDGFGFGGYGPALETLTAEERAALPGNFSVPVLGALPVTQGYSPLGKEGLTFPAEWVPQPADEHLVVTDPNDKKAVWNAVAKKMRAPGEPLPRTRLVPLSTSTSTTSGTTTVLLPITSQSAATTSAAASSPSTTIAPESSSSTATATSIPNPKPSYGANPGNHAGWNYDASHGYAGGAYNPHSNHANTKPAGSAAAYGGAPVTVKPAVSGGAYAALTSRAAAAASTAKTAGNVYVNAAASAKGWWAAVGAVVGAAVAVLAL
ncbi:hypothetical protein HDU96_008770 [Phlyctochytrium bullatum]|nr:hypothetical protein HDU96_008770 [Phlyctochytrium bullatum]